MPSKISCPGFLLLSMAVLVPSAVFATDPQVANDGTVSFESNWHQWRGPFANGQASPSAKPSVHWDAQTNVAWVTDIAGRGSATPAVWGEQIFVLSAEPTDRKAEVLPVKAADAKTEPPDVYYRFLVTCLDRKSGHIVWQKVACEEVPHAGIHPTHTYAAGSPTTDGERLYVSFGSRGLYAYSLNGELIWQKRLGQMRTRFAWGEAVTPALAGDSLIVNWDQEEGAFIVALDAKTGEEKWRTDRPGEVTSWNTPLITTVGDRTLAVVNGTGKARAYDVANGDIVWECGGQTVNAVPSPIRYEDFVVCMSGYRSSAAFAIPISSTRDVTDATSLRWKHFDGTPYVPSPLVCQGRLYFTAGNTDVLTTLDLKNGTPINEKQRLGIGNTYASPLSADGRIYFVGREGTCVVISDDSQATVLSKNLIPDTFDASPVAVGNQLLLRSWTRLYSISSEISN